MGNWEHLTGKMIKNTETGSLYVITGFQKFMELEAPSGLPYKRYAQMLTIHAYTIQPSYISSDGYYRSNNDEPVIMHIPYKRVDTVIDSCGDEIIIKVEF